MEGLWPGAKCSGLHDHVQPPPISFALELVCLIARKDISASKQPPVEPPNPYSTDLKTSATIWAQGWMFVVRPMSRLGTLAFKVPIKVPALGTVKTRRDIHLVKIKYCQDTRPQNQLNAAKQQHKDLCNILQEACICYSPHHPFGCGWHHLQHPHSEAFQGTVSRFSKS